MSDKQPNKPLSCSVYERLNFMVVKERTAMIASSDESIGHRYLGRSDGHLDHLSVKRQSAEATMTLAHSVCNERNRRGTALGHLSCNERNQQLYSTNILF
mgnify:CR=1 FL=1